MAIEIKLPYRLESPNQKGHWAAGISKNKKVKKLLYILLKLTGKHYELPVKVTITREGPRLLDDDNVVAGAKNLRDNIADWLRPGLAPGQADGQNSGITWEYGQRKARQWAVIVKIVPIIDFEAVRAAHQKKA